MSVDLSALLRGECHRIDIDLDIDPSPAPDGINFLPGAHLSGNITDTGGYIRLDAVASVPYEGECARCLSPVSSVMNVVFARTLVPEGVLTDEALEEDLDEYLVIRQGCLDMEQALHEAVFLELPSRLFCSDDCPGLCPVCGRKLGDTGECTCVKKDVDPRWGKLRELLDGFETDGDADACGGDCPDTNDNGTEHRKK